MFTVKAKQIDINRINKKLDSFHIKPTHNFFNRMGKRIEKVLYDRSPYDTGRLRSEIRARLGGGYPAWSVSISVNTENNYGEQYGRTLDQNSRFHYRSTSRRGQKTKGWFSRVMVENPKILPEELAKTAQEMKEAWCK